MIKALIISAWLLIIAGCSNGHVTAAGVVAYAVHDGQHYLLLADHAGLASYRGYGAFGGGLESNETPEQGALREFHEETACYFLGKVQAVSKEYVRNEHYVSFVVRVPFIAIEDLNQQLHASGCEGDVYSERANWIWLEKTALLNQIQEGDSFKSEAVDISLWDKSTLIIKKAHEKGLLP